MIFDLARRRSQARRSNLDSSISRPNHLVESQQGVRESLAGWGHAILLPPSNSSRLRACESGGGVLVGRGVCERRWTVDSVDVNKASREGASRDVCFFSTQCM
jgi:hypothetical protein